MSYDAAYPSYDNAWRMGTDPVVDAIAARQMLADPQLRHEFDAWDPQTSVRPGEILTGNDSGAVPLLRTPQWDPPAESLAGAVWDTRSQYPHTTPAQQDPLQTAAAHLVDAKTEQDLSRMAWGDLGTVGAAYAADPSDPQRQHASDTSVEAAFKVMSSAAVYQREHEQLRATNAEALAAEERRRLRAQHAPASSNASKSKRPRTDSSPSGSEGAHKRPAATPKRGRR
ncbi:hypothetical protein HTV45_08470 [Streptomyces sp. CHD11]|uniref:hypothetical protein n=1 Tax=Streptomyces sp. CHD11 TaxID=2741325 RepID=UPI001BFCD01B|nr:hypothetical protein [Streptomyces sp. CHD11]MBT3150921.1 hypothetical protein [Streptomyces sp. CHD11]